MLGWIKGTMAEKELRTADQDYAPDVTKSFDYATTDALRRYFIATALPALEKANLGECASLEGFKHAYALVSSRAFIVDAYHGLAMVPIADAFNHSLENHTHLESDHDVCSSCGSLAECLHDAEDADNTKEGTHGLQAGQIVSDSDPSSKELEDTCEMVANAFIPPFAEVFNTYGEHLTNAQLLTYRASYYLRSGRISLILAAMVMSATTTTGNLLHLLTMSSANASIASRCNL
ncbi:hypothetical protein DFH11DRAFT_1209779 [Phellopilus nigrolimitatus]|nr:hypothetical protein DFH11DRAFT_1209779 [Phellopilus nigrolimitatus]